MYSLKASLGVRLDGHLALDAKCNYHRVPQPKRPKHHGFYVPIREKGIKACEMMNNC